MARSIIAVAFGIADLLAPGVVMFVLTLLFAIYLVADGCFAIAAGFRSARAHERWGAFVAEGILDGVLAIAIGLLPVGAIVAFMLLTAGWAVITGALLVGAAIRLGRSHGGVWLGLAGVVSMAWGIAIAIFPFLGALILAVWFGGYAIAFGILLFAAALGLRRQHVSAHEDVGTLAASIP